MKYKALLFDADGTLLDFKESEQIGLKHVFEANHVDLTDEILTYYLTLNEQLWKGFEQGLYPKNHIFEVRFQQLLDHFQLGGNGHDWEAMYREELNKGCHLIPSAMEVCEQLYDQYAMYIVTNGLSKTQYQRLHDSGLDRFFQDIFVSEDIGYQKPQPEYFAYVLDHVPFEKEEMLVIGDSLSSDILGANQANIDACWYCAGQSCEDTSIKAKYEIEDLRELWNIL